MQCNSNIIQFYIFKCISFLQSFIENYQFFISLKIINQYIAMQEIGFVQIVYSINIYVNKKQQSYENWS